MDYQDDLTEQCSFPLLQDTEEAQAWQALAGGKDDFYVYRSDGTLAIHLPAKGATNSNLSTAEGYANIEALLMTLE